MGVVRYVKNDFLQTLGEQQQEFLLLIIILMVVSQTLLWLVTRERYLLMELGLLRDFVENFPCETKDIIFTWRRAHKVDTRWECPCKVRMAMWGDIFRGGVRGPHLICMQGGNGHMRWIQGENAHARWEWPCKVTFQGWWRGPHLICMQGGNGHARSMQGKNAHVRWDWPHEVTFQGW